MRGLSWTVVALALAAAPSIARADDTIRPRLFFGLSEHGTFVQRSGNDYGGFSYAAATLDGGAQIGDWLAVALSMRLSIGQVEHPTNGVGGEMRPGTSPSSIDDPDMIWTTSLLVYGTFGGFFEVAIGPTVGFVALDLWEARGPDRPADVYWVGVTGGAGGFSIRVALATGGTGPGGRRGCAFALQTDGLFADDLMVWTLALSIGPQLF